jgi:hypothetical protein
MERVAELQPLAAPLSSHVFDALGLGSSSRRYNSDFGYRVDEDVEAMQAMQEGLGARSVQQHRAQQEAGLGAMSWMSQEGLQAQLPQTFGLLRGQGAHQAEWYGWGHAAGVGPRIQSETEKRSYASGNEEGYRGLGVVGAHEKLGVNMPFELMESWFKEYDNWLDKEIQDMLDSQLDRARKELEEIQCVEELISLALEKGASGVAKTLSLAFPKNYLPVPRVVNPPSTSTTGSLQRATG